MLCYALQPQVVDGGSDSVVYILLTAMSEEGVAPRGVDGGSDSVAQRPRPTLAGPVALSTPSHKPQAQREAREGTRLVPPEHRKQDDYKKNSQSYDKYHERRNQVRTKARTE
jgi:hypothetical protein